ncbi:MAG: hypothetical protein WAT39_15635 [Planctomycetota bacterium]
MPAAPPPTTVHPLVRCWPLVLAAIALALADAYVRLTFGGRARNHEAPFAWFIATAEWTIPTWFSVAVMAATGLGCLRQQGEARTCWRLLGLFCCYLAADDLLAVHERVGEWLHPALGDTGVYSWVIVLGPVFALIGLLCAVRLWRALAAEPARRRCLLLGFTSLGIAIAIEVAEDRVARTDWQPRGIPLVSYAQGFEETIELLGPVLLFAAAWARPRGTAATASRAA